MTDSSDKAERLKLGREMVGEGIAGVAQKVP
jgi:hypothetical protein